MKTQELIQKALIKYGVLNQLDMVIEESAELIQAINKAKRAGIVNEIGIFQPSKECTMDQIKAYHDLCSEVADMMIVLLYMEELLNKEFLAITYTRKLNRLEKTLNA
jgi:NTP pyrophosphatase (non-canonical NTP hydrolase)